MFKGEFDLRRDGSIKVAGSPVNAHSNYDLFILYLTKKLIKKRLPKEPFENDTTFDYMRINSFSLA